MQLIPPPLRRLPPTPRRFIQGFSLGAGVGVAIWISADALWFKVASPFLMGAVFGTSYALKSQGSEQSRRLLSGLGTVAVVVLAIGVILSYIY